MTFNVLTEVIKRVFVQTKMEAFLMLDEPTVTSPKEIALIFDTLLQQHPSAGNFAKAVRSKLHFLFQENHTTLSYPGVPITSDAALSASMTPIPEGAGVYKRVAPQAGQETEKRQRDSEDQEIPAPKRQASAKTSSNFKPDSSDIASLLDGGNMTFLAPVDLIDNSEDDAPPVVKAPPPKKPTGKKIESDEEKVPPTKKPAKTPVVKKNAPPSKPATVIDSDDDFDPATKPSKSPKKTVVAKPPAAKNDDESDDGF